jgi:hypothetical protein
MRLPALTMLVSAVVTVSAADAQATTTTTTFRSPGAYEFTVPAGVDQVTVVAVGGAGGDCIGDLDREWGPGGRGASVAADMPVSSGARLFIGVAGNGGDCVGSKAGAGGVGGGGSGGLGGYDSAGGGGASTVTAESASARRPLVVAGGGGGAGAPNIFNGTTNPGADAGTGAASGLNGGAGTLGSGGRGGSGGRPVGDGKNGGPGPGGAGGNASPPCYAGSGGGGGGAGYWGGGGGGACQDDSLPYFGNISNAGAGGGGSSFVHADGTPVLGPLPTTAPPGVSLTYPAPQVEQDVEGRTLKVTNHGSAPLIVAGVLLAGAEPDDFVVDSRCRQPVAPRASCEVEVRSGSATITLLTNAAIAPRPVKLSGGRGEHGTSGAATRSVLVTCPVRVDDERYRTGHSVCRGRRVSGEIALTRSAAVKATLTRGGVTYATGARTTNADGSSLLAFDERRRLKRGTYTLVFQGRRERIVLRPNATRGTFPRLSGLVF